VRFEHRVTVETWNGEPVWEGDGRLLLESAGFCRDYPAVEYRNPDTYSVNGYVAMQLLAEGVCKASSLDTDDIAQALRQNPVKTLLGELRIECACDLIDPEVCIYQVKDSKFPQIER